MKTHVILCSHNGDRYIKDQILSILHQKKKIDFIYIFDFASTDATRNIINNISQEYKQIKIYFIAFAQGAAKSFFFAINQISPLISKHDCVFLADQDDIWLPEKSKVIVEFFQYHKKKTKYLLIAHDVYIVDAQLNTLQKTFYTGDPYKIPRDLVNDRALLCNPLIGHTMCLSGELLHLVANHVPDEKYLMHDWAITLIAQRYGEIHVFTEKPLSLYRQHANNLLGSHKKRRLAEKITRTYKFTNLLVHQAIQHGKNINFIDDIVPAKHPTLKIIRKISNSLNHKWIIYPYLIKHSLITGPTLKRKLLFLFFIVHWLTNPKVD